MNDTPLSLPEWLASQILAAGDTGVDLQQMMNDSPFRPSAVRTVAESGDFEVAEGMVRQRSGAIDETWLPELDPRVNVVGEEYLVPVTVSAGMLAGQAVPLPRSIAGVLEVPRWYHRALDSRLGKRSVTLIDLAAQLGPVSDFLTELQVRPGDTVVLVFDRSGGFDVRI